MTSQKTFKKVQKLEKFLLTSEKVSYIIWESAWEKYAHGGNAMNREIAPRGGNFRGVCPIIGRLRRICTLRRSPRHDQLPAGGYALKPVFFMSRNDTHG